MSRQLLPVRLPALTARMQNEWVPPEEIWCRDAAACPAAEHFFLSGHCPAPLWQQYLHSLFWAVMATTGSRCAAPAALPLALPSPPSRMLVGIGRDIMPVSALEHAFTVAATLLGLLTSAFLIGSASSALASLDSGAVRRRQQLEAVNEYMAQRRVPSGLQRRIRQYISRMLVCCSLPPWRRCRRGAAALAAACLRGAVALPRRATAACPACLHSLALRIHVVIAPVHYGGWQHGGRAGRPAPLPAAGAAPKPQPPPGATRAHVPHDHGHGVRGGHCGEAAAAHLRAGGVCA